MCVYPNYKHSVEKAKISSDSIIIDYNTNKKIHGRFTRSTNDGVGDTGQKLLGDWFGMR